ncbi:MAG: SGNH/GDSL hydrolase family protein, partial [Alphaproteobacteria bacterium]
MGIEGVCRLLDRGPGKLVQLELNLQPYMMFTAGAGNNAVWRDVLTNTDVPSQIKFNNYGFSGGYDFSLFPDRDFRKKHAKMPGERVVVITGGSVVHGVGATANDKTIAGQLEAVLNARQSKYKYRVVNLGMGSWIAYQQFIGLSLFATPLDPDWVVVMDGYNDAASPCAQGTGPGNPMGWPKMLYLTGGGKGVELRSALMQWLIRNSAAARVVTGMQPSQQNGQFDRLYFDNEDPDKRFTIKMRGLKMADLDKQIDFYLLAQENVMNLFSSAKIIYSTQPQMFDNAVAPNYRKAYTLEATRESVEAAKGRLNAELDGYMARASETKCDSRAGSAVVGYFMARSALRMEQAAAEWSKRFENRTILYFNAEMAFPYEPRLRRPQFIDSAHMSDFGQRHVAEYFAGFILEKDLGVPFDPAAQAAAVRAETLDLMGTSAADSSVTTQIVKYDYSAPPAELPGTSVSANPVMEGVTAKERSSGALQLNELDDYGYHRVIWSGVPATSGRRNTVTI